MHTIFTLSFKFWRYTSYEHLYPAISSLMSCCFYISRYHFSQILGLYSTVYDGICCLEKDFLHKFSFFNRIHSNGHKLLSITKVFCQCSLTHLSWIHISLPSTTCIFSELLPKKTHYRIKFQYLYFTIYLPLQKAWKVIESLFDTTTAQWFNLLSPINCHSTFLFHRVFPSVFLKWHLHLFQKHGNLYINGNCA